MTYNEQSLGVTSSLKKKLNSFPLILVQAIQSRSPIPVYDEVVTTVHSYTLGSFVDAKDHGPSGLHPLVVLQELNPSLPKAQE